MNRTIIDRTKHIVKKGFPFLLSPFRLFPFRLFPFSFFYLFLFFPFLVACEKDIPIDYHDVDKLYVAEASVTQEGTLVRLSMTQNVNDNSREHYVEQAVVVVSIPRYALADTLKYTKRGYYQSSVAGVAGETYDMDIYVDGRHFHSSSVMQQPPQVTSLRFVWQKVLSERMLLADLRLQDTPDENSYYFMHIYRNNIGYRWAVMSDDKNKNGELQQLFQCTTKRDMDKGDEDALREGDKIRMEVRAIDRAAYDYLYSMQVMDNAGTNPIENFTGGCLGYFSAYHIVTFERTFHIADIEEDD